jgi:flavorubredoxin
MPKAIIIYETRSGNTKMMAEAIQAGLQQSGIEVLLKTINDVDLAEIAGCEGVVLGAPTYHKDLIPTMKTFLFKLEKTDLKGKVGAAFGAWGWSGEGVGMISDTMKHIYGMDVLEQEEKLMGTAKGPGQSVYRSLGREIADKIKAKK